MNKKLIWFFGILFSIVIALYLSRAVPAFLDIKDGEVISGGACAYPDKSELMTKCVENRYELYKIALRPNHISPDSSCSLPERYVVCDQ